MPKLLLFAPCEKVIFDVEGLVSIISLIEKVEASVPKEVSLPPGTSVPLRWETIAVWSLEEGEVGLYEQMTEMIIEQKTVAAQTTPRTLRPHTSGSRTGVKIASAMNAVPLINGALELRLSYRKIGDAEWIPIATYPVEVVLVQK